MIDPTQLRGLVVFPVLESLGLHSEAAVDLLMGTCAQESQCGRYLKQLGTGPAIGVFQMEPATHKDLWENFLHHRPQLADKVAALAGRKGPRPEEMVGNLNYASAMCRVHYFRRPEALPKTLKGQAEYWKKWYNTAAGAGTVDEYLVNWKRYIGG